MFPDHCAPVQRSFQATAPQSADEQYKSMENFEMLFRPAMHTIWNLNSSEFLSLNYFSCRYATGEEKGASRTPYLI